MIFRGADAFQQAADALSRILDFQLLEGKLYDGGLVVGIINFEIPRQTEAGGLTAQHPGAKGMERADPRIIIGEAFADKKIAYALLHLSGGLVCKCYGQNRTAGDALVDQISDAIRDGARLARPGTRENQDRSLRYSRGFALSGIQFVKKSHDGELAR